jgi:hypothetical protein
MKGIVESLVLVKEAYKHHNNDPKLLDLWKTAATTEGRVLTYNQSTVPWLRNTGGKRNGRMPGIVSNDSALP